MCNCGGIVKTPTATERPKVKVIKKPKQSDNDDTKSD